MNEVPVDFSFAEMKRKTNGQFIQKPNLIHLQSSVSSQIIDYITKVYNDIIAAPKLGQITYGYTL